MKWIEVIQLRSVESNRELLKSNLQRLIDEVDQGRKKQEIRAYNRVFIDTDCSVHLYHDSKKVKQGGSELGLRIVNALKEFGLVNHNIWIEIHSG